MGLYAQQQNLNSYLKKIYKIKQLQINKVCSHQSLLSEHYKQGGTVRDLNSQCRTLNVERLKIDFGAFRC